MGSTSAVLLAAGESTRMGELKALLPWQDATLLEYQVECLLRAEVTEVVVVLGHGREKLEYLVRGRAGVRL